MIASIVAIAAISGVFVSGLESGTTVHVAMMEASIDEQINLAPYAILGQVKSIGEPYEQGDENITRNLTDVVIKVKEVLKGDIDEKEITIVITTNSDQEATFENNEKVLLFLWKGSETDVERGNYAVSGMFQGKFKIDQDGNIVDPKDTKKKYSELEIKDKIKKTKS